MTNVRARMNSGRIALAVQRLKIPLADRDAIEEKLIDLSQFLQRPDVASAEVLTLLNALLPPGETVIPRKAESILARLGELPQLCMPDLEVTSGSTEETSLSYAIPGTGASLSPRATGPIRMTDERTSRYEDRGLLGIGGMGEVRRMRDRDLNRTVAMKLIRQELMEDPVAVARFLEEAQATSQLEHPGIVPVYELGMRRDGRLYFTMREVRGRTLKSVIQEVYRTGDAGRAQDGQTDGPGTGWSFHRLIDAFHTVCEAVAYAHSRGVIHRDLKPSNVLVGAFGEVLVVDWGLARVRGVPDRPADAGELEPVVSRRTQDLHLMTRAGAVSGTPAYMPPEQARGELDRLGPASDVYALGAILYEILSGRPPYEGETPGVVLAQVLTGPPKPPGPRPAAPTGTMTLSASDMPAEAIIEEPGQMPTGGPRDVPEELKTICLRAMAYEAGGRYPDALVLAHEVEAWLEGSRRREQALELVGKADTHLSQAEQLRQRAAALRWEAATRLKAVKPNAPVDQKCDAWSMEDQAVELERQAELKDLEHRQTLRAALNYVQDLPEVFDRLANVYHEQHVKAEDAGDLELTTRAETLLRTYDRGRFAAYLKGDGALTLVTDPPDAEVLLFRYVERDRRLVPVPIRPLDRTPLLEVPLPMGSYLLEIRAEGRLPICYPVHIRRQHHWDGIPPAGSVPHPIYLPRPGELGSDDVYVPAGWCQVGGDREAVGSLPKKHVWIDGFFMRRFPVTHREYLEFIQQLAMEGNDEELLRRVPRAWSISAAEPGFLYYGLGADGRWHLKPADPDGDPVHPDWPVSMIDWASAAAYARFEAERTGLAWRLPSELEWEKAARGVDGRIFVWGSFLDPTWACMAESHEGRKLSASIYDYPQDVSLYGVRGLAGNLRDWCMDVYEPDGPPLEHGRLVIGRLERVPPNHNRTQRGGSYADTVFRSRAAFRFRGIEAFRMDSSSFRLARSLAPEAPPFNAS